MTNFVELNSLLFVLKKNKENNTIFVILYLNYIK